MFCDSKEIKTINTELLDKLTDIKTHPDIIGLTHLISQTGTIPEEMVDKNHNLVEPVSEQRQIGCLRFLLGFWTTLLGNQQEEYAEIRGFQKLRHMEKMTC